MDRVWVYNYRVNDSYKFYISMNCDDSSMVEQSLFQVIDGGSTPTSSLQLIIKEIDYKTAQMAYKYWHYLGHTGFLAKVNYGAFFDNWLVGSISYGIPNARNIKGYYNEKTQGEFIELTRLAMSEKCPKNSESRFIAISLKLLHKKYPNLKGIITYADTAQGHTGVIYKASNFKYLGLTAQKTDLFVNGKKFGKQKGVKYSEIDGEWKKRSRKHLFIKLLQD